MDYGYAVTVPSGSGTDLFGFLLKPTTSTRLKINQAANF